MPAYSPTVLAPPAPALLFSLTAAVWPRPDDWTAYLAYFDSLEALLQSGNTAEAPAVTRLHPMPKPKAINPHRSGSAFPPQDCHTSWSQAAEYIAALLATEMGKVYSPPLPAAESWFPSPILAGQPSPCRGPFLASLELLLRQADRQGPGACPALDGACHRPLPLAGAGWWRIAGAGATVLPVVVDYFRRFGSKLCCYPDLRPYLAALVFPDAETTESVFGCCPANAPGLLLALMSRLRRSTNRWCKPFPIPLQPLSRSQR